MNGFDYFGGVFVVWEVAAISCVFVGGLCVWWSGVFVIRAQRKRGGRSREKRENRSCAGVFPSIYIWKL